jgi:hypothetical protein
VNPIIALINRPIFFIFMDVPLISLSLGLVVAISGIVLWWLDFQKVKHFEVQLNAIVESLKALSAKKPLTPDSLSSISEIFNQTGVLEVKECWQEFKEALVEEKDGAQIQYSNSVQAENFFTADFILHSLPALMPSLPGLATGAGLLGTFLALLAGLTELHVSAGGGVEHIDVFINALSGKFFSSILGLFTALTLTFYINQFRNQMLHYSLAKLQHQLNILFPRQSAEKILIDIKLEFSKLSRTVGFLSDDLTQKLPAVIKESIGGDVQSLLMAINSLAGATEALKDISSAQMSEALTAVHAIQAGVEGLQDQNKDAITESIRSMMEDFRNHFNQSAGAELTELQENLSRAAKFMEGMQNQREKEAYRQEQIDERMRGLLEALENASRTQGSQMESGGAQMRDLLAQIAETTAQMSQNGHESLQKQLQDMLGESQKQTEQWRAQLETLLAHNLESFQKGSQGWIEQVNQESERTSQKLAEHQDQMTQSIGATLDRLTRFIDEREINLQKGYEQLEKAQINLAETLSDGAAGLSKSTGGLQTTIEKATACVQELSGAQLKMGNIQSELQSIQKQLSTGITDAGEAAQTYKNAVALMGDSLERQSRHFQTLQNGLDGVLETLNDNLLRYQTHIQAGLNHATEHQDKHFSQATQVFGSAVIDLQEKLDELTTTLEESSKRLVLTGR